MSSLKDIMNMDVEPLQSRTVQTNQQQDSSQSLQQLLPQDTRYTDSRYLVQPLRLPPIDTLPISTSIPTLPPSPSVRRKRSRHTPKTPALGPGPNPANPSSPPWRRSSVGTEHMDSGYSQERSMSPSAGYSSSNSNSMRGELRRGTEPMEIGERRTPVTGRISKARKGLPVHQCQYCDRKPFSRAEHLRRHQQSHGPPGFSCQIKGCDKAFHRKDLLERHMERHSEPQNAQASHQLSDNGRRSRSASADFMKPEPPQTPPQQRLQADALSIEVMGSSSSFSTSTAPAPIQPSPNDTKISMMGQYSPASPSGYRNRNASAANNQNYQQAQSYQPAHQRLASPIQIGTMPQYSEAPMVTFIATSPILTHPIPSSLLTYSVMNASPYASNSGFQHSYTTIPVSSADSNHTFSPQMVSERLLSVQVPHSTPCTTHPNSPPYHSDNGSNSTWSTPSDMTKSHIWPPQTRDRAFTAPGSQYPPAPMMDLNNQFFQQQIVRRTQAPQQAELGIQAQGGDEDIWNDDCVSTTATFGATDTEPDADSDQYQDEVQLAQQQYVANGGAPIQPGYMEDYYEQNAQWNC